MLILFFVLGLVIFALHWVFQKKVRSRSAELLLGYLMFFTLGFNGFFSAVAHFFYSAQIASLLDWPVGTPFQFEVGVASLSFGVIALLSFWKKGGFRLAALMANVIWLIGDALVHLSAMLGADNFPSGISGTYFWAELLIPLFILLVFVKAQKKTRR